MRRNRRPSAWPTSTGHRTGRGDRPGQGPRVAPQAEVAGDEVLGAGRHHGQRRAGAVRSSSAETVPSPPTATRQRHSPSRRGPAHQGRRAPPASRRPRPAGPVVATRTTSSSTSRRPRPAPEPAIRDDPDPGRPRRSPDPSRRGRRGRFRPPRPDPPDRRASDRRSPSILSPILSEAITGACRASRGSCGGSPGTARAATGAGP